MKYILLNLNLPLEIINHIYSYLNNLTILNSIKKKRKIWYKRLITKDYLYYPIKIYLLQEEKQLKILKKIKAYKFINNIHSNNLCSR